MIFIRADFHTTLRHSCARHPRATVSPAVRHQPAARAGTACLATAPNGPGITALEPGWCSPDNASAHSLRTPRTCANCSNGSYVANARSRASSLAITLLAGDHKRCFLRAPSAALLSDLTLTATSCPCQCPHQHLNAMRIAKASQMACPLERQE